MFYDHRDNIGRGQPAIEQPPGYVEIREPTPKAHRDNEPWGQAPVAVEQDIPPGAISEVIPFHPQPDSGRERVLGDEAGEASGRKQTYYEGREIHKNLSHEGSLPREQGLDRARPRSQRGKERGLVSPIKDRCRLPQVASTLRLSPHVGVPAMIIESSGSAESGAGDLRLWHRNGSWTTVAREVGDRVDQGINTVR